MSTSAARSSKARRSSGSTARSRRRPWRRRGARSPRSMRRWWSRGPMSLKAEGQIQEARSAYQQAVDELDDQAGAATAQPGHRRRRATSRSCRSPSRAARAASMPPPPPKQSAEAQISTLLPAEKASAEAALAQAAGRSGQDLRPGRRERARGAVRAAGRRHRQSAHAAGRHPDSRGRRARAPVRPASGRSRRRS